MKGEGQPKTKRPKKKYLEIQVILNDVSDESPE
jgi:hypothetical protein